MSLISVSSDNPFFPEKPSPQFCSEQPTGRVFYLSSGEKELILFQFYINFTLTFTYPPCTLGYML
jgi:hypothetical protein